MESLNTGPQWRASPPAAFPASLITSPSMPTTSCQLSGGAGPNRAVVAPQVVRHVRRCLFGASSPQEQRGRVFVVWSAQHGALEGHEEGCRIRVAQLVGRASQSPLVAPSPRRASSNKPVSAPSRRRLGDAAPFLLLTALLVGEPLLISSMPPRISRLKIGVRAPLASDRCGWMEADGSIATNGVACSSSMAPRPHQLVSPFNVSRCGERQRSAPKSADFSRGRVPTLMWRVLFWPSANQDTNGAAHQCDHIRPHTS